MICQLDLFSSLAALVGHEQHYPDKDSENFIDVLLGKSDAGRDELILEATGRTAFRQGDWVMIPPYKGPAVNRSVNIELGNSDEYLLYDLKEDPGQKNNLAQKMPDKLEEMIQNYEHIRGTE